jgi:predicted small secreted protein
MTASPRIAFALACLLALAACNTMAGLGEDTRADGDALSHAAQKTKGY